jgi:hypothetical protein
VSATAVLIERRAEADAVHQQVCDRLLEPWRDGKPSIAGWVRLRRRWTAQGSASRLRHGARQHGDILTLGELAWAGFDIADEHGVRECGIRVVSRQYEIRPGKRLRTERHCAAKLTPGALGQRFEGRDADDRGLRRDVTYIGTAWAHNRHPPGQFRVPSLAGGWWWGCVGREDEFYMLGFIAGPVEFVLDPYTNRPCIQWRT